MHFHWQRKKIVFNHVPCTKTVFLNDDTIYLNIFASFLSTVPMLFFVFVFSMTWQLVNKKHFVENSSHKKIVWFIENAAYQPTKFEMPSELSERRIWMRKSFKITDSWAANFIIAWLTDREAKRGLRSFYVEMIFYVRLKQWHIGKQWPQLIDKSLLCARTIINTI